MLKKYLGVLVATVASLGLATAAAAPTFASTSPGTDWNWCQRTFEAAVHEDNNAYNAHDIDRYTRILHPDLIVMADGEITVGREAHLDQVRDLLKLEGWTWEHEILSTTMHGCRTGIAVMDFRFIYPPQDLNIHYSGTMTLVQEHGRWRVAQDNIFTLPS